MTKRIFLTVFSLLAALLISACDLVGGGPTDPSFKLTVDVKGSGTVTGTGIDCGSDCDETFTQSTQVTLTATPDSGETFEGWSGAGCTGTEACIVTVDSDKTVTADFTGGGTGPGPNPDGPFLFQAFVEAGKGTISSEDGNINCTSNPTSDPDGCTHEYAAGTSVKVTATPDADFVAVAGRYGNFSASECSVDPADSNVCTYTMSKARDSKVSFRQEGASVFEVATESDDAEQYTTTNTVNGVTLTAGEVDLDSSDLELNFDENFGVGQLVGIRFANVTIPEGETIDRVYIEFTPVASDLTIPDMEIKAQAAANPPTFSETNNDIGGRPLTTGIPWKPEPWQNGTVNDATRTPNLASLLTEAGWQSGNAVVFVFSNDGTDAQRNADSVKNGGGPRLVITYQ